MQPDVCERPAVWRVVHDKLSAAAGTQDENTRYIDIGPVNKVINLLCCWFEDPSGPAFKK